MQLREEIDYSLLEAMYTWGSVLVARLAAPAALQPFSRLL